MPLPNSLIKLEEKEQKIAAEIQTLLEKYQKDDENAEDKKIYKIQLAKSVFKIFVDEDPKSLEVKNFYETSWTFTKIALADPRLITFCQYEEHISKFLSTLINQLQTNLTPDGKWHQLKPQANLPPVKQLIGLMLERTAYFEEEEKHSDEANSLRKIAAIFNNLEATILTVFKQHLDLLKKGLGVNEDPQHWEPLFEKAQELAKTHGSPGYLFLAKFCKMIAKNYHKFSQEHEPESKTSQLIQEISKKFAYRGEVAKQVGETLKPCSEAANLLIINPEVIDFNFEPDEILNEQERERASHEAKVICANLIGQIEKLQDEIDHDNHRQGQQASF